MSRGKKILFGLVAVLVVLVAVPYYTSYQQRAMFSSIGATLSRPDPAMEAIDRLLSSLTLGNIAFNTPTTIPLGEAQVIHLALSTRETVDNLKTLIETEGQKTGAQIRVGSEMEAHLTGKGFKIQAITPETQAVSAVETTEWKWEVEPTEGGPQRLHLSMSAVLNVDGQRVPRAIRTFERTIEIQVTWTRQISDFVGNNWQWLWATILVPVIGYLYQIRSHSGLPRPSPADASKLDDHS
ncbi:MAG TPA: hypothetical protein PKO06_08605 [Candidatus Ozemobacteraceae bacterium]|nr:hypothetical protein [Candidatus Ozemobacteraceae bacterium]